MCDNQPGFVDGHILLCGVAGQFETVANFAHLVILTDMATGLRRAEKPTCKSVLVIHIRHLRQWTGLWSRTTATDTRGIQPWL